MLKSSNRVLASMPVLLLLLPVCDADIIAQHIYDDKADASFNAGAGMAGDDGTVYDNRLGQSFTAIESGQVGAVSFSASVLGPVTADLRLSVMTFTQGQPGGVLGSMLISSDTFYDGFLPSPYDEFTHTVDFASMDITLQSGQQFALVFSTDTPNANYRICGDYEGYTGGASLFSQNGSQFNQQSGDFFFQVQAAIPAPGAATLLGLAALTTSTRRRR